MGARSKAGERVSDCLPDRLQYREPCLPNAFGRKARVYQLRVNFATLNCAVGKTMLAPLTNETNCIQLMVLAPALANLTERQC